jgi:hypothetical protein
VKNQQKAWKIKSMPQSLWDFLYLCWDEPRIVKLDPAITSPTKPSNSKNFRGIEVKISGNGC